MTETMHPNTPGSRRAVPRRPTEQQVKSLGELVHQGERWVLRGGWDAFLAGTGDHASRPIPQLTRGQRIAAAAWLRQQQHDLHRALEDGGRLAPDGWLQSLALYRALVEDL